MSTFLYDLAEGIPSKLTELRFVIGRAKEAFETDEELYNVLCRYACVLTMTTLERFLKELQVSIQSDLNAYISDFSSMPVGLKREFSRKIVYFEGVAEQEIQKRATQLIKFFEKNSVRIDMSAFTYKENSNKNPSNASVDSIFFKYGINSILHCISGNRFEEIFDNDTATDYLLRRAIKRFRSTLYSFPYRDLEDPYRIVDWVPVKGVEVPQSLWHTFIEQIARRRHSVVHADTTDNPTSWEALRSDSEKLEVLMNCLLLAASANIGRDLE